MFRELSVAEHCYQAVLTVIEDGLQITEAAAKAGVTRQALHEWLTRYAEGGLEALADRSHRPRSYPHQMDPAVEVRLTELRGLHPGWGADRLRYRLEREGVDRCRRARRLAGRWSVCGGPVWVGGGVPSGSSGGWSVVGRWSFGS